MKMRPDVHHAFERLLIGLVHGPIGRDTGIGDDDVEAPPRLCAASSIAECKAVPLRTSTSHPDAGRAQVIGEGP
jgi:hypothetical protein